MSGVLHFLGTAAMVALGIIGYQLAKHFAGWPGVVALMAVILAVYFAADAAIERSKRR